MQSRQKEHNTKHEVRDGMVRVWFIRVRLVIGGNDPEAEASSAELGQAIPVPTGQG